MATEHRHWPVRAWIRVRLPEPETPPLVLMGAPPPPQPPGDFLAPVPPGPDPRKRIFAFEEEEGEGVVRIVWDADDPERLNVELRLPGYGSRLPPERIRKFWTAVRARLAPLGTVRVEASDPPP
ncbi:MAG: hypothetical protein L3K07_04050 [Thermoplasmata archaeon]|nr:hypothetical protein [Thermoplasmata archaeon]